MQQNVTSIAEAKLPEDSPFWEGFVRDKKTPEEFDERVLNIAVGRTKGRQWWSKQDGTTGNACWATFSGMPFSTPYRACHSALQNLKEGKNCFVFSVILHKEWLKYSGIDDEKTREAVIGFYDWLSSTTGPFGPAMKEAILIREKTTGLVIAQLWPDATKTPKIETALACLNSRDLTEHAHKLLSRFTYYYHFENRKDAAFAFLAARMFNEQEKYSYNYCDHNGYEPGRSNFSKHYINNKYNVIKQPLQWTFYVNRLYMEKMFVANTLKSFVKQYDEVKAE